MRTVIKGKVVEKKYSVITDTKIIKDKDGNDVEVFNDKPFRTIEKETIETPEILSYEGEPHYNRSLFSFGDYINISEDETVLVEKTIFRADLNEYHLFTDKVVEEKDVYKVNAGLELDFKLTQFNKQMIESNDQMNSYCKLHKLNPAETDAIELFNFLFPDKEYEIVDGVMKVYEEEKKEAWCSSSGHWLPSPWETSNIANAKILTDAMTVGFSGSRV